MQVESTRWAKCARASFRYLEINDAVAVVIELLHELVERVVREVNFGTLKGKKET